MRSYPPYLPAIGVLATLFIPTAFSLTALDVPHDLQYAFVHGGELWLGAGRDGIFAADLETGRVRHLTQGSGIPVGSTTCGASAFGRVWLGSREGLFAQGDGSQWSKIDIPGLESPTINCMAVQERFLWVGTSRGAARYDSESGTWEVYTAESGLSDSWINSIWATGEKVLFGTMRGGVCELDTSTGNWLRWDKEDGLPSNCVFSVSAGNGCILAATPSGFGAYRRNWSSWISYSAELPSPAAYVVFWDKVLGAGLVGTGKGLVLWNPSSRSLETIDKVGEIELGRINWIGRAAGLLWITRNTDEWFGHTTTGVLGYNETSSSWLRPIYLDILIDQAGYYPGGPKRFILQCNEPLEGNGSFSVQSLSGDILYSGSLGPRFDRPDWDAYYWVGEFTPLQVRGNFTIEVAISGLSARSMRFEMDNDVVLEECGELVYKFLKYMRCGYTDSEVGWTTWLKRPRPCHMDDGILPNGTHMDATGGWHCAGLWGGKYSEYHTYVLFNILLAYDLRPDFFGSIDRDADGLPDILNEAMWGCDFLVKMQVSNGSIFHEVEKVEVTDGIVGTVDDRKIRGWVPLHNGLLAVAGLAGTASLIHDSYRQESERYLSAALRSFARYREGITTSVQAASMVLACAQLYRATSNRSYLDLAEYWCNRTLDMPYSEYYGPFVPCALGWYLEMNQNSSLRERVKDYICRLADSRIRGDTSPENPQLPFEIPTWSLYIQDPWAAEVLFAYRVTGNLTYLRHGMTMVDYHLGVNPYSICFLEGAGTINPPSYASHFRSGPNPRAAVPGSIPYRGLYLLFGKPHYEEGETWLINTNFIQAISLIPKDTGQYPLEVSEGAFGVLAAGVLAALLLFSRVPTTRAS